MQVRGKGNVNSGEVNILEECVEWFEDNNDAVKDSKSRGIFKARTRSANGQKSEYALKICSKMSKFYKNAPMQHML